MAKAKKRQGRPRKKETEQKQLAIIVQDLVKSNPDVSDVGMIIALLKDDVKSLEKLKKECTDIDEFLQIASRMANVALVTSAIEAATGYDYEETEQIIHKFPKYDENGTPFSLEVEGDKKVKKRHAKKDGQLLKFILSNRLPEYFNDTKKVEINKKTIEIKADTEAEIRGFAGRLLDVIDAEFVGAE
jgi:hypothetical protein